MKKTTYRYQEEFAAELAESWRKGERDSVRIKIRTCADKAQVSYISAVVAVLVFQDEGSLAVLEFVKFLHPNN